MTNPGGDKSDKLGQELHKLGAEAERLEQRVPAWLRPTGPENRLPVVVAILVAVALQLTIPDRYTLGPRWLIPALEVALLAVLVAINPIRLSRSTAFGRYTSLALVIAITVDNGCSAAFLDQAILTARASGDALGLLGAGAAIYLTNIIAFGIWYWELDRGGPFARADATTPYPDFLFPQMSDPDRAPAHWEPRFFDYLYVSFTNVVAFSPTDTMPLSRWAKALMAAQSTIALSTISLVIARAVNVLR